MTAFLRRRGWLPAALRWLGIAGLAVALYGLLGWLALPPVLRHVLENQGAQALGRPVSVAAIDVNPWTLRVTVHGLSVGGRAEGALPAAGGTGAGEPGPDRAAQLAVERLQVDLSAQSLWRWAPVIDALAVDQPVLRIQRSEQGAYDIEDVLARLAPAEGQDADAPPAAFALYNVQVRDGRIAFDDRAAGQRHVLEQLDVGLPFISSLPAARDVEIRPELSFVLNGSRIQSTAQSLPFALSRKTAARLDVEAMDLAPYLRYLPAGLPVRVEQGRLGLALRVTFEQAEAGQPELHVAGQVRLEDGRVAGQGGSALLVLPRAVLELSDLAPLGRRLHAASLVLEGPQARLARAADGSIALVRALAGQANPAADRSSADGGSREFSAPSSWTAALDQLSIERGTLAWADASVGQAHELQAEDLSVSVKSLAWPMQSPAEVQASARLAAGRAAVSGTASDRQADLAVRAEGLALAAAVPYLKVQGLRADPAGSVSATGSLQWRRDPARLQVKLAAASVSGFALNPAGGREKKGPDGGPAWRRLSVTDATLDVFGRRAAVGAVTLEQPQVLVARDGEGRWMYEDWLSRADGRPSAGPPPAGGGAARRAAWTWAVESIAIQDGTLRYRDRGAAQPVVLDVRGLALGLGGWSSGQEAARTVKLSARMSSRRSPVGQLALEGRLADFADGVPRRLEATRVDARRLPLQVLAPFIPALSQLDVHRADGSFVGVASYHGLPQGARVAVRGDVLIEGVRADNRMPAAMDADARRAWAREDHQLISWRALELDGVDFAMAPGSRTRLDVAASTLTDLFARLIVTPQGELNLQGLYRNQDQDQDRAAQERASVRTRMAAGKVAISEVERPRAPAAAAALAPVVNLGPTRFVNGRIAFTDQFVQPNYSANLSELTGRLGAFSSQAPRGLPQMADLELQGMAQETAALLISGQLNPLAQPLMLDIRGQVQDLDLPPLSPYTVKYAGYGIERGKLNVDVRYEIDAQGRLTASNKIRLNQLVFGDKVGDSSLPVKLAVALLADRNGVINVELPVTGSINDPQFSMGGLILRALGSLVAKVVTSPLSLLNAAVGGGGGGEAERSSVAFEPGAKWLEEPVRAGLDRLAQAMADRPALQVTLTGMANFDAERVAFQRAELAKRIAEVHAHASRPPGGQRGESGQERQEVGQEDMAAARWLPPAMPQGDDYEQALSRLYRRSEIGNKPRNFIGLARSVPAADMEKLITAGIPATPAILQQVAAERAAVVRAYLLARGVPPSRVFLGASRLATDDAPAHPWQPRVDIELGVR